MKSKIIISSFDAKRLEPLLNALSNNAFPGSDKLETELSCATD